MNRLNKTQMLLAGLAMAVISFSCSSDDDPQIPPVVEEDPVVEFSDDLLEGFIRSDLNLSANEEITESKLAELVDLNIGNTAVSSLKGLEKAVNLETLVASFLVLEDVDAIAELTSLRELQLNGSEWPGEGAEKLSFLQNLNELELLNLRETGVSDISVLAGKQNLVHLNLRQAEVSDISPLEGMIQMQYLNFNRCGNITDISALDGMVDLYYLSLRNAEVGDEQFQMFSQFTKLVESNIRNTGITDISPLVPIFEAGGFLDGTPFDNKVSLDLQNNQITNPCVIAEWVDNFPTGELEGWDGSECDD